MNKSLIIKILAVALYIAGTTIAGTSISSAQSDGDDVTDESSATHPIKRTPQANFFEGKRSSADFFSNKSVTPTLNTTSKQGNFGQDILAKPVAPTVQAAPSPETSPDENWSANNASVKEVKETEQNIEDPKIRDLLEQSKKIKEALFGTTESASNTPTGKITNKTKPVNTKEIERF